jgi:hypothetical protein
MIFDGAWLSEELGCKNSLYEAKNCRKQNERRASKRSLGSIEKADASIGKYSVKRDEPKVLL